MGFMIGIALYIFPLYIKLLVFLTKVGIKLIEKLLFPMKLLSKVTGRVFAFIASIGGFLFLYSEWYSNTYNAPDDFGRFHSADFITTAIKNALGGNLLIKEMNFDPIFLVGRERMAQYLNAPAAQADYKAILWGLILAVISLTITLNAGVFCMMIISFSYNAPAMGLILIVSMIARYIYVGYKYPEVQERRENARYNREIKRQTRMADREYARQQEGIYESSVKNRDPRIQELYDNVIFNDNYIKELNKGVDLRKISE